MKPVRSYMVFSSLFAGERLPLHPYFDGEYNDQITDALNESHVFTTLEEASSYYKTLRVRNYRGAYVLEFAVSLAKLKEIPEEKRHQVIVQALNCHCLENKEEMIENPNYDSKFANSFSNSTDLLKKFVSFFFHRANSESNGSKNGYKIT